MRGAGRVADTGPSVLVAWVAVVVGALSGLAWIGWPSLLLPGRGSDLAHHLLLIDYIERHRALVSDPALVDAMGEMAAYTPGAHVLAVIAGALSGTDGFRAVYPLVALATALKLGFVFLIARRELPEATLRTPLGLLAVTLVLLPRDYFLGSFLHDSFIAQVVAEPFAVAAWWAILAWRDRRSPAAAAIVGALLAATFYTWPIWLGPPALVAIVVMRRHRTHLLAAVAPVSVVAGVHLARWWGWSAVAKTSGAVLSPSLAVVGWLLPALAVAGIAWSTRAGVAGVTRLLLAAIALQAAALWALASAYGASTPYMALKMAYLAAYPLAVLGAVGVAGSTGWTGPTGFRRAAAWVAAVAVAVAAVPPLLTAPRPVPVVSLDLYEAGRWTREHLGTACVDYLVPNADTAYWLHLAVLGNPRASARTAEVDAHDERRAIGRWLTGEGRPYAIADLTRLPDEVRSRVDVVRQFGAAAVIRRPGAACLP